MNIGMVKPDQIPTLERFLERYYAIDHPLRHPKFRECWFGDPPTIIVVEHGGEVIGIQGMIHRLLQWNDQIYPCAWYANTRVDQDYIGLGVGHRLLEYSTEKYPNILTLSYSDTVKPSLEALGFNLMDGKGLRRWVVNPRFPCRIPEQGDIPQKRLTTPGFPLGYHPFGRHTVFSVPGNTAIAVLRNEGPIGRIVDMRGQQPFGALRETLESCQHMEFVDYFATSDAYAEILDACGFVELVGDDRWKTPYLFNPPENRPYYNERLAMRLTGIPNPPTTIEETYFVKADGDRDR